MVTGEKREAYERLMTEKAERKGRRDEGGGARAVSVRKGRGRINRREVCIKGSYEPKL